MGGRQVFDVNLWPKNCIKMYLLGCYYLLSGRRINKGARLVVEVVERLLFTSFPIPSIRYIIYLLLQEIMF